MYRFLAISLLVLTGSYIGYSQSAPPVVSSIRVSYSKEQATRGKLEYNQNCGKCHMENLRGKCEGENVSDATEYICAAVGNAPPLVGKTFLQRWYSVGDLFSQINGTM